MSKKIKILVLGGFLCLNLVMAILIFLTWPDNALIESTDPSPENMSIVGTWYCEDMGASMEFVETEPGQGTFTNTWTILEQEMRSLGDFEIEGNVLVQMTRTLEAKDADSGEWTETPTSDDLSSRMRFEMIEGGQKIRLYDENNQNQNEDSINIEEDAFICVRR